MVLRSLQPVYHTLHLWFMEAAQQANITSLKSPQIQTPYIHRATEE